MSVELCNCTIFIAIIEYRTVITGENDDCVLIEVHRFELGNDFSNSPVNLQNGITPETQSALAFEGSRWHAWYMWFCECVVQEKWCGLMLSDKSFGFIQKSKWYFFVRPPGCLTTGHKSDSANTVDDGVFVAVVRTAFHLQQFRIFLSSWFRTYFLCIIHCNRIIGVCADGYAIFHENSGHPVCRCRKNKGIIEPKFIGARSYPFIPVFLGCATEPEVPLAHDTGSVSSGFKHGRECELVVGDDKWCITGEHNCIFVFPGVLSG